MSRLYCACSKVLEKLPHALRVSAACAWRRHSTPLLLNNDLAEGRYEVSGHPIWLRDIHIPIFTVSTITDHVAPWRSSIKFKC